MIKSDAGKVALANSITLTPGTVTVDVGDDYVYVHAIDEYAEEGLANSVLEKKIERMMYIERQSQTDNRSAQRGFLPRQAHAKNYGGEMEIYYFVLPHAEADTVQ